MAEPADRLAQGADDQGDGGISDFIDDGGRVGGLECAPAPAHSVGATQRQDMSACVELKAMAIAETNAGTDPFTLGRGLRRKGHVRGPRFLRGGLRAEERRLTGTGEAVLEAREACGRAVCTRDLRSRCLERAKADAGGTGGVATDQAIFGATDKSEGVGRSDKLDCAAIGPCLRIDRCEATGRATGQAMVGAVVKSEGMDGSGELNCTALGRGLSGRIPTRDVDEHGGVGRIGRLQCAATAGPAHSVELIREAEQALALPYIEILGTLNVADLLSKQLVGRAFKLMRGMALGLNEQ